MWIQIKGCGYWRIQCDDTDGEGKAGNRDQDLCLGINNFCDYYQISI